MLEKGVYQHYKGSHYQVHDIAKHSETEEWMVIYTPLYGEESTRHMWVRPLTMFTEKVSLDVGLVPRFKFISEEN